MKHYWVSGLILLAFTTICFAANEQINWQVFDIGGGTRVATNFKISDSLSWSPSEKSQSSNFKIQSGFINSMVLDITSPATPSITSPTHPDQTLSYVNNSPAFNLIAPADESGIAGYYYIFDQSSFTVPSKSSGSFVDVNSASIYFSNKADGTYYLHTVAKDGAGNVGTDVARYKVTIKTVIEANKDNTFYLSDGTKVEIPADSVSNQTKIEVSSPLPAVVPQFIYDPGLKGTNILKEIKLADGTVNLQKEATITIPYTDSDISGLNENNLKISYYDESAKKWRIDLNSTVNTAENKIVCKTKKMTVYRIVELSLPLESVDNLSNYPNPVVAAAGRTTTLRYTLKENANVELKIYDLTGELVWQKNIIAGETGGQLGPNEISWDCKNGNGDYVGAGGYICIVKAGTKTVKTKIGVK